MMQVSLIVATTLDGFIAQEKDQVSTAWTSVEDKKWFGEISRQCEIVVMGRRTYETMGRPLPKRVNVVMTRGEIDGAKSLDELKVDDGEGLFTTNLEPAELIIFLQQLGRKRMAVCGGASIYSQFFTQNLIDNIYLTIEPVFFGVGVKFLNEKMYKKCTLIELIRLSENTTVFHLDARATDATSVVTT